MPKHANGTVYGKYLKIKNGSQGVKNCSRYINDPDKIMAPINEKEREIFHMENTLHYIQNDPKTKNPSTGRPLVSGHNCSPDTATWEFSLIEKLYHSHKKEKLAPGQTPNQAFHIILSYKGTDTDPSLIHQMGLEFARRLCGDEFQSVIATHLNTGNFHNHILVNAYALDGRHKFKDSYHVYHHFRDIANEISLEYGLPVFVNDEWKQPYRSWKEVLSTEEGQSWKQDIIAYLEQAIAISSSYEEVLHFMEQRGYEIQKNPRSVTFRKDGIRVRDSRLGYPYTREGMISTLEKQKQHRERQKITDEVSKMRNKHKKKRIYPPVFIPLYDQYGRRRSFLIRLLLLLRESVKQAMDEYYDTSLENVAPDNLMFMKAEKKLALLEEAITTADRYSITSPEVLDMKLRELHARNAPYRSDIYNLEDYLERAGELKELIEKYQKLLPNIKANGLCPDNIVFVPEPSLILENKARLNPMKPKTRSDLFKAIHDSGYTLARKFNTLTEQEARRILRAIREGRRDSLPDGLAWGRFRRSTYDKKTDIKDSGSVPKQKRIPIDLKNYDSRLKETILEFKATADTLASYGITDKDSMDMFLKELSDKARELDSLKADSNRIGSEIKELFRLKRNISRFQKAVFVYGPLYAGSTDNLKQSIDVIRNGCSRYDWLTAMRNRLDKLPDISENDLNSMEIPHPEEYRFFHDLLSSYPDLGKINVSDPAQIHLFLARLKSDNFLDHEIQKELEKEKAAPPKKRGENINCSLPNRATAGRT